MSAARHPGEQLVDYVDGRLESSTAEEVRSHLENCADCRGIERELHTARAAVARLRTEAPMPGDLLAAISRQLDAESRPSLPESPATPRVHPVVRLVVGGLAAAALVVLYLQMPTAPRLVDLPTLVAHDTRAAGSRSLPLAVTSSDAAALERYFAGTSGPRVRVIDLSMMQITLEGGLRHILQGRPSALYAYRTPAGDRLVCQMFEGRLADLPPPSAVRESNGFRFHIYTRDGITLVFWQEGDLVCVLASELPRDEVIALAQAKAMAPA
jgi:anti-sigma factor RsiW